MQEEETQGMTPRCAGKPYCDCDACYPPTDEDWLYEDAWNPIEMQALPSSNQLYYQPPTIGDLLSLKYSYKNRFRKTTRARYAPVTQAPFMELLFNRNTSPIEEEELIFQEENDFIADLDYLHDFDLGHSIQEELVLNILRRKLVVRRFRSRRITGKDQSNWVPKLRSQKRREAKPDYMQTA